MKKHLLSILIFLAIAPLANATSKGQSLLNAQQNWLAALKNSILGL